MLYEIIKSKIFCVTWVNMQIGPFRNIPLQSNFALDRITSKDNLRNALQ